MNVNQNKSCFAFPQGCETIEVLLVSDPADCCANLPALKAGSRACKHCLCQPRLAMVWVCHGVTPTMPAGGWGWQSAFQPLIFCALGFGLTSEVTWTGALGRAGDWGANLKHSCKKATHRVCQGLSAGQTCLSALCSSLRSSVPANVLAASNSVRNWPLVVLWRVVYKID